jgi:hypothetical protein
MNLAIILLLIIAGSAAADDKASFSTDNGATLPHKKVIAFGSDRRSTENVAKNFAGMPAKPFDGSDVQLPVWGASLCSGAVARPQRMEPADSPVDNPLKGLVPYAGPSADRFPHSLEFDYLPLSRLMTGPGRYNWKPLDDKLVEISGRSCQAIFRIWLEFPGQPSGLPDYLLKAGVKVTEWKAAGEKSPQRNFTPDYEDERLVAAMEEFIAALGQRYDADARVGFITAGLLGLWGEWHTYPRTELFASKRTQERILTAYERAFHRVPVLLRYPAAAAHPTLAETAHRPFGYHDDSFAWGTLDTGQKEDSWYYLPALKAAGPLAIERWRTHPIGGEIRPEVWGQIFDAKPSDPRAQDFAACVRETHASWVMDSGMFREKTDPGRYARAGAQVRRMGYDFRVATAEITRRGEHGAAVALEVVNQGVAPFYQDWRLELGAIAADGTVVETWPVKWTLRGLQPGDTPTRWAARLERNASRTRACTLALRVVNPMTGGKRLRFANAAEDRDAKGWLSLGLLP